jgi:hypothetical protein
VSKVLTPTARRDVVGSLGERHRVSMAPIEIGRLVYSIRSIAVMISDRASD